MTSVFISILNFNGKNNTLTCIDSIKKINLAGIKLTILVLDNGSTDGSPSEILKIKNKIANIETILNKENLGFAGGHNVGIKYALENGADYILIMNNDTYVDKDFLRELLKVAINDDSIGILVPKIYFTSGFEFHKGKYKDNELGKVIWYAGGEMDWQNVIGHHRGVDEVDKGQYQKIEETELATGCCMLVKREVFDRVGIFDEKYFLYYEDSDLSVRVKSMGFKIVYVPFSFIYHKNAASAGGSGSKLQDYFISRNRLLFGIRYASLRAKVSLLKESIRTFVNGRYWQKRGVLDFYLGRLRKGSFKI